MFRKGDLRASLMALPPRASITREDLLFNASFYCLSLDDLFAAVCLPLPRLFVVDRLDNRGSIKFLVMAAGLWEVVVVGDSAPSRSAFAFGAF